MIPTTVGSMSVSVNSSSMVDLCENGVHDDKLLPASDDVHGGVIVDMTEPMDPNIFLTMLRASISQWRQQVLILIKFPLKVDVFLFDVFLDCCCIIC